MGIQADGQRDVLGLWIEQTEGAKFWLKVFNELKTRGCQDILIAVVDGLKGLTEAISAAYPVRRPIYAGARITRCSTASPTKMRTGSSDRKVAQLSKSLFYWEFLARPAGIEPATPAFGVLPAPDDLL